MMKLLEDMTAFIFLEDQPQKADAIFVAGNSWAEPSELAAKLYRDGYAAKVFAAGRFGKETGFFPGPSSGIGKYDGIYETEADFMKDILLKNGVREMDIYCDRESEYTLQNAQNIKCIIEKEQLDIKKAIICCQAFHARRCQMYFEYVFPETELLICPAVTQQISRENWMTTEKGIAAVCGEIEKCGRQFGWMLTPEICQGV